MGFFHRYLLPALLVACLFFCACAAPAQETGAPASESANNPAGPAPAPSPTSSTGNPVWLFYQDFYSAAQEPLDGLHAALAQSTAPEAIDGELLLSALEERLTEGMVSFGLLMSSEDGSSFGPGYASNVEGAALGSGTILPKAGQAALSFAYTDGFTLTGSLTPYRLRYTRHAPGQAAPAAAKPQEADPEAAASEETVPAEATPSRGDLVYSMLLLHAPQGWAAVLDLGGGPAYALRFSGEELGLYAIGYTAPQGNVSAPLITYENCVEGARQSWLYTGGNLSINSQESE